MVEQIIEKPACRNDNNLEGRIWVTECLQVMPWGMVLKLDMSCLRKTVLPGPQQMLNKCLRNEWQHPPSLSRVTPKMRNTAQTKPRDILQNTDGHASDVLWSWRARKHWNCYRPEEAGRNNWMQPGSWNRERTLVRTLVTLEQGLQFGQQHHAHVNVPVWWWYHGEPGWRGIAALGTALAIFHMSKIASKYKAREKSMLGLLK